MKKRLLLALIVVFSLLALIFVSSKEYIYERIKLRDYKKLSGAEVTMDNLTFIYDIDETNEVAT